MNYFSLIAKLPQFSHNFSIIIQFVVYFLILSRRYSWTISWNTVRLVVGLLYVSGHCRNFYLARAISYAPRLPLQLVLVAEIGLSNESLPMNWFFTCLYLSSFTAIFKLIYAIAQSQLYSIPQYPSLPSPSTSSYFDRYHPRTPINWLWDCSNIPTNTETGKLVALDRLHLLMSPNVHDGCCFVVDHLVDQ